MAVLMLFAACLLMHNLTNTAAAHVTVSCNCPACRTMSPDPVAAEEVVAEQTAELSIAGAEAKAKKEKKPKPQKEKKEKPAQGEQYDAAPWQLGSCSCIAL